MKKIKNALPVAALLLGLIGAFAFKPHDSTIGKATHATYFWYSLVPGGNKNNASDYMQVQGEPACDPGTKVCAVHAQDNGSGHPLGIPATGAVTTNSFIDQVDHRSSN